jgi:hypothetical protein
MKTEYGSIAPLLFTSALDMSEWSASHPSAFTPGERAPSTHWIGDWMDFRVGLDAVEYRKISLSCREPNPGCSNP